MTVNGPKKEGSRLEREIPLSSEEAAEISESKETIMTAQPLIDRQIHLYADKLVLTGEDFVRIEARVRQMRSREFARLFSAAWRWVKTLLMPLR